MSYRNQSFSFWISDSVHLEDHAHKNECFVISYSFSQTSYETYPETSTLVRHYILCVLPKQPSIATESHPHVVAETHCSHNTKQQMHFVANACSRSFCTPRTPQDLRKTFATQPSQPQPTLRLLLLLRQSKVVRSPNCKLTHCPGAYIWFILIFFRGLDLPVIETLIQFGLILHQQRLQSSHNLWLRLRVLATTMSFATVVRGC